MKKTTDQTISLFLGLRRTMTNDLRIEGNVVHVYDVWKDSVRQKAADFIHHRFPDWEIVRSGGEGELIIQIK